MLNKYIYAALKAAWDAIVVNTAAILVDTTALQVDTTAILVDTNELILESQHDSELFPDDSNRKITFTAGGVADTFGAWAEVVVDVTGETFSSIFATQDGHISGLLIEDLSVKDKVFILEVAQGAAKIKVSSHRFLAGNVKFLAAVQFIRVRAPRITAGETIYYRMKCENAGATCEISFRYHFHV